MNCRLFSLGAIPSDDQIRLTPSMTNKKGKLFIVYFYRCVYLSGNVEFIVDVTVDAFDKIVAGFWFSC